jgi:hypothetical protein
MDFGLGRRHGAGCEVIDDPLQPLWLDDEYPPDNHKDSASVTLCAPRRDRQECCMRARGSSLSTYPLS